jgi:Flp pilus assembly secretin CpaC
MLKVTVAEVPRDVIKQLGIDLGGSCKYGAAGVNLNDIGLLDPTRPDKSPWVDAISGASVRNGLPARLQRA